MHPESAYGLWLLVIINSAVFIFFAFSFVKPKTTTDWRSLGAFSAFVVALFTEMYGFPQMALAEFGDEYRGYMETTPAWIPGFRGNVGQPAP
jgi:protein-S-isoprenylcysteine O-methyltransferase Ste14